MKESCKIEVLRKVAAAQKEDKRLSSPKNYALASIAAAPALLASTLARIPTNTLDSVIETKIRTPSVRTATAVASGLKGRSAGRVLGGVGAGLLTYPLYSSAIKDLSSNNSKERARGTKKLVASSIIHGTVFNLGEGLMEGRVSGRPAVASLKHGLSRGLVRTALGLVPAVLVAKATASSVRSDKKKGNAVDTWIKPMAAAAATWGTVAGADALIRGLVSKVPAKELLTKVKGRVAGSVVSAALGLPISVLSYKLGEELMNKR